MVEHLIKYKINVKFYKYKEALASFKEIVNFLDIDNLDLGHFQNQLHFDINSHLNERKRNENFKKNNSM